MHDDGIVRQTITRYSHLAGYNRAHTDAARMSHSINSPLHIQVTLVSEKREAKTMQFFVGNVDLSMLIFCSHGVVFDCAGTCTFFGPHQKFNNCKFSGENTQACI